MHVTFRDPSFALSVMNDLNRMEWTDPEIIQKRKNRSDFKKKFFEQIIGSPFVGTASLV